MAAQQDVVHQANMTFNMTSAASRVKTFKLV
jgi:hypothetical protein